MPTSAFEKLSKTKKQKLITDGIEVFSKLKYKQTNVNEITKALGITRTAFYYYFTDKKDFYEYLLYGKREDFLSKHVYNRTEKLDFFELLLELFDYLADCKNTPEEGFFRDLFINIDYVEQNNLLALIFLKEDIEGFTYINGLEKLSMETKEEVFEIVNLLFTFLFITVLKYYASNDSKEKARLVVEKKIKYLQNGIIKDEYRGDNI